MGKTKSQCDTGQPPPLKKSKTSRKRDVTKRKAEKTIDTDDTKKVKREDTSNRKKENKGSEFIPFKASLAGRFAVFCPPAVQDILLETVEKYVCSISQLVVKGSMVADEVLLQYLRSGQPSLPVYASKDSVTSETVVE